MIETGDGKAEDHRVRGHGTPGRAHPRGGAARRLPERARGRADRRQGPAHRPARPDRPAAPGGHELRPRPTCCPSSPTPRRSWPGSTSPRRSRSPSSSPTSAAWTRALRVRDRFDEVSVFLSASETHNRHNVNRSVAESLDGLERVLPGARAAGLRCEAVIAVSFGCPYEGEVPPDRVLELAARLAAAGAQEVGFGDTTGMANPRQVGAFFTRARAELGDEVELTAHFHNTRGQGLANVVAALDAGCTSFESSFGELGGCPVPRGATGNIATEDLVSMLEEMGVATGRRPRARSSRPRAPRATSSAGRSAATPSWPGRSTGTATGPPPPRARRTAPDARRTAAIGRRAARSGGTDGERGAMAPPARPTRPTWSRPSPPAPSPVAAALAEARLQHGDREPGDPRRRRRRARRGRGRGRLPARRRAGHRGRRGLRGAGARPARHAARAPGPAVRRRPRRGAPGRARLAVPAPGAPGRAGRRAAGRAGAVPQRRARRVRVHAARAAGPVRAGHDPDDGRGGGHRAGAHRAPGGAARPRGRHAGARVRGGARRRRRRRGVAGHAARCSPPTSSSSTCTCCSRSTSRSSATSSARSPRRPSARGRSSSSSASSRRARWRWPGPSAPSWPRAGSTGAGSLLEQAPEPPEADRVVPATVRPDPARPRALRPARRRRRPAPGRRRRSSARSPAT